MVSAQAARQHGLLTREQILAAGASVGWLKWAVRDGRLTRVRQGVYALAGTLSEHQALMAACLAGGPAAAASHLAAAAVWGAEQVVRGRVEITTFDRHPHRLPGVTTHQSKLDARRAITRHLNVPIVVPALTVVQLAERCDPYLVRSVANDLVKRNWTETPEGLLLVDYAWPKRLVGLEYNGARDHETPLARIDDAARRCRLAALGWRMLDADRRQTNQQIVRWVMQALVAATPQVG